MMEARKQLEEDAADPETGELPSGLTDEELTARAEQNKKVEEECREQYLRERQARRQAVHQAEHVAQNNLFPLLPVEEQGIKKVVTVHPSPVFSPGQPGISLTTSAQSQVASSSGVGAPDLQAGTSPEHPRSR